MIMRLCHGFHGVCREWFPVSHQYPTGKLSSIHPAAVGRMYAEVPRAHLVRVVSADQCNHCIYSFLPGT
jgi:hypothetical protein